MTKGDNGAYNYDLKFVKDGAEVQPNGKVTIKLPLPEEFAGKTVYVFRNENGTYTNMNAKIDGNNVVFETDHFSDYVLTTQDLNASTSGDTSTSDSTSGGTSAAEPDKGNSGSDNPDTGVALMFGAAAIAGAAVIVSRKRR